MYSVPDITNQGIDITQTSKPRPIPSLSSMKKAQKGSHKNLDAVVLSKRRAHKLTPGTRVAKEIIS